MREVRVEPSESPPIRAGALRRVAAATRAVDSTQYVTRVGWSEPVHRLEGAAGAVWMALADHDRVDSLAAALGVDADDEFLVAALDLLAEHGLIETDADG